MQTRSQRGAAAKEAEEAREREEVVVARRLSQMVETGNPHDEAAASDSEYSDTSSYWTASWNAGVSWLNKYWILALRYGRLATHWRSVACTWCIRVPTRRW